MTKEIEATSGNGGVRRPVSKDTVDLCREVSKTLAEYSNFLKRLADGEYTTSEVVIGLGGNLTNPTVSLHRMLQDRGGKLLSRAFYNTKLTEDQFDKICKETEPPVGILIRDIFEIPDHMYVDTRTVDEGSCWKLIDKHLTHRKSSILSQAYNRNGDNPTMSMEYVAASHHITQSRCYAVVRQALWRIRHYARYERAQWIRAIFGCDAKNMAAIAYDLTAFMQYFKEGVADNCRISSLPDEIPPEGTPDKTCLQHVCRGTACYDADLIAKFAFMNFRIAQCDPESPDRVMPAISDADSFSTFINDIFTCRLLIENLSKIYNIDVELCDMVADFLGSHLHKFHETVTTKGIPEEHAISYVLTQTDSELLKTFIDNVHEMFPDITVYGEDSNPEDGSIYIQGTIEGRLQHLNFTLDLIRNMRGVFIIMRRYGNRVCVTDVYTGLSEKVPITRVREYIIDEYEDMMS